MKRTSVVLDEALLEEAVRVSGGQTYSRTIERALKEMVGRARTRRIDELVGSGLWVGDLAAMRDDAPEHADLSFRLHRKRQRRR